MKKTIWTIFLHTVATLPILIILSACAAVIPVDYFAPQSDADITHRPLTFGIYLEVNNSVDSHLKSLFMFDINRTIAKTIEFMGETPVLADLKHVSKSTGFDVALNLVYFTGFSVTDTAEISSPYTGKILLRVSASGVGASAGDRLNELVALELQKNFSVGKPLYRKTIAERRAYLERTQQNQVARNPSVKLSNKEPQSAVAQTNTQPSTSSAPQPTGSPTQSPSQSTNAPAQNLSRMEKMLAKIQ